MATTHHVTETRDPSPSEPGRATLVDPHTQYQLIKQLRERVSQSPPTSKPQHDALALMLQASATLSRAVTTPGADVVELALEVMRQHGLVNVAFDRRREVAAQGGEVDVTWEDQVYATLTAQGATSDRLRPWAAWLAAWIRLDQEFAALRDLAMRDELTGVWNRRFLKPFLERQIAFARERGGQVTVLAFDIDNFKLFNDRFGHGLGDEILQQTVRLLQAEIRDTDIVARVGGDEFVVVFWDAREKQDPDAKHPRDVLQATERFRLALKHQRFKLLTGEMPDTLSISGGLATFPGDGQTADDLLRHADLAAMASKQEGKNAITFGA